jgi:hypothetical protein
MRVLDPWLDTPDDDHPDPGHHATATADGGTTDPAVDGGRPSAAVGYADLTVDEMVEGLAEGPGLVAVLDGVRCTRGDAGVTVTVDLYGKLVDLVLEPLAMRGRAVDLAATVHRLTTEAAAAAHSEAHGLLMPHLPPAVAPFLPAPTVR